MSSTAVTIHKEPLSATLDLFQNFAECGVRYCHWKSNEHLLEGLSGKTDLDVLVDRRGASQCENVLLKLGYRRVISQSWAAYPGIEDWLGLDAATGKLIHIHLHYRLWTGRNYVKEQHLPWEQLLLDTAVEDGQYHIMAADPNVEIVLLAVRAACKATYRDGVKAVFAKRSPLSSDVVREYEYLYTRMDRDRMCDYASRMLGCETGKVVADIIADRSFLKACGFRRLKRTVSRSLSKHRRCGTLKTCFIYSAFSIYDSYLSALRKLGIRVSSGKRLHTGGAVVALTGIDGAGKSTVTREICRWLGWKLNVRQVYLGVGDGDIGLALWSLKRFASLRSGKKHKKIQDNNKNYNNQCSVSIRPGSGFRALVMGFYHLLCARHRLHQVKQARSISMAGGISLADRYPQNQVPGLLDGPPLPPADASGLLKYFYKTAASYYRQMEQYPPDVVIQLYIPIEVAMMRKPEHDECMIAKKADILQALDYPPAVLVRIDASQPLADVVLEVKNAIWRTL